MKHILGFREGNADKFWQIERTDTEVQLLWGRTGSKGQSQSKSFDSAEAAETFLQQQLKAKLKKGYQPVAEAADIETSASTPSDKVPSAATPAALPVAETRQRAKSTRAKTTALPQPVADTSPPEPGETASPSRLLWPPRLREKEHQPQYFALEYPPQIKTVGPVTNRETAWKKLGPELSKAWQNALWIGDEAWQEEGRQARKLAQQNLPESLEPEMAALILHSSQRREAVDFVWQTLGPQATLQAWVTSRHLQMEYRFDAPSRQYVLEMTQLPGAAPLMTRDLNPKLWALRQWIDRLETVDPIAHAEVIASLLPFRQAGLNLRLALDWVCWQKSDWLQEDLQSWPGELPEEPSHQAIREWFAGWLLWPWVRDPASLNQLTSRYLKQVKDYASHFEELAQVLEASVFWLVERAGQDAAQTLYAWITAGRRAGLRKKAVQALQVLDSPQIRTYWFELLKHKDAGKAAHMALQRDPQAGIRCLIQGLSRRRNYPEAEQLLASLLRSLSASERTGLSQELGPQASPWLAAETPALPAASELPDYFVTAPWQKPARKWQTFTDLPLPDGPAALDLNHPLLPFERELRPYVYDKPPLTSQRDAEMLERFAGFDHLMLHHLDWLSQEAALEAWNQHPASRWNRYDKETWTLNNLALRFGVAGLPGFLSFLEKHPEQTYPALCLFDTPQVVPQMLKGLSLLPVREHCQHWFLQHPATALRGLIPLLLNPHWKLQLEALRCLHMLRQQGASAFASHLQDVLPEFSTEVQQALQAELATDPCSLLPARMPKLPDFVRPGQLPPLCLHSGESLPSACQETLALTLLLDSPYLPYAGVSEVQGLCTPASLEAFALALWESWLGAGGQLKQEWCFWALARLGRNETVRQLVPRLEKWPGERSVQRALVGLEILKNMTGADAAWPEIHRLSLKTRYPSIQTRAAELIQQWTLSSGQSADSIGDRLVPRLGLDATGGREFQFGESLCRAQLNAQAELELWDDSGRLLKGPPGQAKSEAHKQYLQFAKEVAKQLRFQSQRLEQAMTRGRRWTQTAWKRDLLAHPLLKPLLSNLVWGAYPPGAERPQELFRLSSGGECLDIQDQPLNLDAGWDLGLPHPLEFLPQRSSWQKHFQEKGWTQPFEQLTRAFFVPALAELGQEKLPDPGKVPSAKVLALISQHNWVAPKDSEGMLSKDLGRGWEAEISLEYHVWALKDYPQVDLFAIHLRPPGFCGNVTLAQVHPIAYSELRRDLASLT